MTRATLKGALVVCCAATTPLAGWAQTVGSGTEQGSTLSALFTSRLEANDNFDLEADSPGTSFFWTNTLTLAQTTRTRTDSLDAFVSGDLRFSSLPGDLGEETELDNGTISVDFARAVADNAVSFDLFYNDADIRYLDPLDTLREDGGFDDTRGEGQRGLLQGRFSLDLGEDAPIGFSFTARGRQVAYRDNDDPDLRDRDSYGVTGEFSIDTTETVELLLGANYNQLQEEDDFVDRTSWEVYAGVAAAVSPITDFTFRLGYGETEAIRKRGSDTRSDGLVGSFDMRVARHNGTVGVDLSVRQTENGTRSAASVSRALELPAGSFDGTVGVSGRDDLDLTPFARFSYGIARPTSSLDIALRNSFDTEGNGDEVLNTVLSLNYSHIVTPTSSFGLSAIAARREQLENDPQENDVTRVTLSASYNQTLTRDWALTAGVQHRSRLEDGDEDAFANSVFLELNRSFTARR